MEIIITIPTSRTLDELINITKHLRNIKLEYEVRDMTELCITGTQNGASVNLKDIMYVLNEYKLSDFAEVE